MKKQADSFPKLTAVGEAALLIELGGELDLALNYQVYALDEWLARFPLPGVTAVVPGYVSLLIHYDPLRVRLPEVQDWVTGGWEACPKSSSRQPTQVSLPVRYGGEDGPDLANVARIHRLSPSEVIRRHTEPVYQVAMMGFTPGFAYLMGLDAGLATPRLANPRTVVPAGSVGIAGAQTGVYPLESPGGWQLIGRTAVALFDPSQDPPFLLSPGDEVRFVVAEGSAVQ